MSGCRWGCCCYSCCCWRGQGAGTKWIHTHRPTYTRINKNKRQTKHAHAHAHALQHTHTQHATWSCMSSRDSSSALGTWCVLLLVSRYVSVVFLRWQLSGSINNRKFGLILWISPGKNTRNNNLNTMLEILILLWHQLIGLFILEKL